MSLVVCVSVVRIHVHVISGVREWCACMCVSLVRACMRVYMCAREMMVSWTYNTALFKQSALKLPQFHLILLSCEGYIHHTVIDLQTYNA